MIVLDSAGYGPVTIDQPVSIISPPGIFAGIAPTTATAVSVDPGLSNAVIVLRGLTLNGRGASYGILHHSPLDEDPSNNRLYVENCTVTGFPYSGISLIRNGSYYIRDTIVRQNGDYGIYITGPEQYGSHASLDGVTLEHHVWGLTVLNAAVAVRRSIATSNGYGFYANSSGANQATLSLEGSQATHSVWSGVEAIGTTAEVDINHCLFFGNGVGVRAAGNGEIRIANTASVRNGTGISNDGGTIFSGGGNNVKGNTTAETSGTITPYTSP